MLNICQLSISWLFRRHWVRCPHHQDSQPLPAYNVSDHIWHWQSKLFTSTNHCGLFSLSMASFSPSAFHWNLPLLSPKGSLISSPSLTIIRVEVRARLPYQELSPMHVLFAHLLKMVDKAGDGLCCRQEKRGATLPWPTLQVVCISISNFLHSIQNIWINWFGHLELQCAEFHAGLSDCTWCKRLSNTQEEQQPGLTYPVAMLRLLVLAS